MQNSDFYLFMFILLILLFLPTPSILLILFILSKVFSSLRVIQLILV